MPNTLRNAEMPLPLQQRPKIKHGSKKNREKEKRTLAQEEGGYRRRRRERWRARGRRRGGRRGRGMWCVREILSDLTCGYQSWRSSWYLAKPLLIPSEAAANALRSCCLYRKKLPYLICGYQSWRSSWYLTKLLALLLPPQAFPAVGGAAGTLRSC